MKWAALAPLLHCSEALVWALRPVGFRLNPTADETTRSPVPTVNVYLVQLQNFDIDVGCVSRPVIPRRAFPKPQNKIQKRAIAREERDRILPEEENAECFLCYSMLWENGA